MCPNSTATKWMCCRKPGLIFIQTLKKKKNRKKNSFWLSHKLFYMPFTDQGQGHSWKENMQQPPLAPYKIISITFYKCFFFSTCCSVPEYKDLVMNGNIMNCLSLSLLLFIFFFFFLLRWEHSIGLWKEYGMLHVKYTRKKKKQGGKSISSAR